MREISCKIIRDLLPSYMDGICSEETKGLVEEHFLSCEECRQAAGRMREAEPALAAESHPEHIDYMKKLKKHVRNRSLLSFSVLFFVMAVGLAAVFYMNTAIPVFWYYVAVPIFAVSAYVLLLDYTFENTAARWKIVLLFASIFDIIYMGILENWLIDSIQAQDISLYQGPFAYWQFMVIALIHAVIFVGAIYMNIQKGNACHGILALSAAGGCASLAFASLLKRLDTPEDFFAARNRELGVILAEGAVLLLVFWFLGRRKKRMSCFSKTGMV